MADFEQTSGSGSNENQYEHVANTEDNTFDNYRLYARHSAPSEPPEPFHSNGKGKGKVVEHDLEAGPPEEWSDDQVEGEPSDSQPQDRNQQSPEAQTPPCGRPTTPEKVMEDWASRSSVYSQDSRGSQDDSRPAFAGSSQPKDPWDSMKRRPNPKIARLRNARANNNDANGIPRVPQALATHRAPAPKPQWRHQLQDGQKLAPLCTELPFLLGPGRYLKSLSAVQLGAVKDFIMLTDQETGMNLSRSREGALLTILRYMGVDWEGAEQFTSPRHQAQFRKLLKAFDSDGTRVRFWQEYDLGDVKEVFLDFHLLRDILRDWIGTGRPQYPQRYYSVLKRLKEMEIDPMFVPGRRFKDLCDSADEDLDAQLEDLEQYSYGTRVSSLKEYAETLVFDTTPRPGDRTSAITTYGVRFDHDNPTGKVLDPDEIVGPVTKSKEGTGFLMTAPKEKVSVKATLEDLRKSDKPWAKWVRWMAGIVVIGGGIACAIVFLYFRVGMKKKAFSEIS